MAGRGPDRGGGDDPGGGRGGGPGDGGGPELDGLLDRLSRSMGTGGLELGGENVRFERAPESGLEVRITLLGDDGEVTSVASMLLPSSTRPAAHPAEVPFVPGAALRVIEDHVRHVLLAMWLLDADGPPPARALAAVLRSSREAGWRLEDPRSGGETGPFRLVKGDQARRVEAKAGHTGPVISLSQKRSPGDVETGGRRS